jgi:hypothetical protein
MSISPAELLGANFVKKIVQWIMLTVLICGSAAGEVRMWTDEDGKRFPGEFYRELLGRIQIRDTSGELHLISVDKLSPADLKYVEQTVVPEVELDFRYSVRLKPEMDWTIPQDKTSLYTCTVKIQKESKLEFKGTLTAELYIIGEEVDGDNYVLVQRDVTKFVFPEGRNSTYEFIVEDVPLRKYHAAWAKQAAMFRGVTYLGYITTVLDSKGNLVAYDTDLGTESWMDMGVEKAIEKLRDLAIEGRGSVYSRHFNERIEKADVPRFKWFRRDNTF